VLRKPAKGDLDLNVLLCWIAPRAIVAAASGDVALAAE
jgi:hypothetical protein